MPAYRDTRDGRWRYRKWIHTPEGKRIRITGTPATDTKAAAEAAERAHIERVMHPERVKAAAVNAASERKELPTFKEYAVPFVDVYMPGMKEGVRGFMRQIVETHLVPFFGAMRLDEILQCHVDAFAASELRRCARHTVNNRLGVLSTVLRYAHENGLIGEPSLRCHVSGSKASDAPVIAVPPEDVAKLVAAADPLYRAVVLLCAEAGLRIGEARGAQWTDLANGEITIRRAIDEHGNVGTPKHHKVRRIPLSPAIVSALGALPKRGLWILSAADGSFIPYRTMLKGIRRLYVRAGVDVPKSDTGDTRPFHALRHYMATECARRGVPVMTLRELLGHEDVQTTQRYVTVTSGDKRDAIALAFAPERQRAGNESPASTGSSRKD